MSSIDAEVLAYFQTLYFEHFQAQVRFVKPLPPSGSPRRYYLFEAAEHQILGVWHEDEAENLAFEQVGRALADLGLAVPKLYLPKVWPNTYYLIEYLSPWNLLDKLASERKAQASPELNPVLSSYYEQVVEQLARLHTHRAWPADFNLPRFDGKLLRSDIHLAQNYFFKLFTPQFYDKPLRLELQRFVLSNTAALKKRQDFVLRDCQARNIMIREDKVYFIDYQSAKWGCGLYDLASLLYQVKAALAPSEREALLNHYLQIRLRLDANFSPRLFWRRFPQMLILRFLQVLGAYGEKGWLLRKPHFLESLELSRHLAAELADSLALKSYPRLAEALRYFAENGLEAFSPS